MATIRSGDHFTSYTVSYESSNHWSVITQLWGSQWPKILPYCLFNVAVMLALTLVDRHVLKDHDLVVQVSRQGHTFVTFVVSYLLLSRVNTGLARYNTARDYLSIMYRESRDLVQAMCVLSADNTDLPAKEWRHEVAYRSLILLRTAMAVVDYPTHRIPAWTVPELNGIELEDVRQNVFVENASARRWAHKNHDDWEETMRVPVRLEYLLQTSLYSQHLRLKVPIQVPQETRLLASVSNFMVGYYGIRKFLTTPVPFPLIQMARTFMFLYVFTVPFVLLGDPSSIFAHCFMVFMLTYGFVGLETVAIELDNPFGDDPNDFDNDAMAMTAYEDTYLTILDVDGPEWTDLLRSRMHDGTQQPFTTEQSCLAAGKQE